MATTDVSRTNTEEDDIKNKSHKSGLIKAFQEISLSDKQEIELRKLTKTFVGIEKPLKNAKSVTSLQDLIQDLHQVFSYDHVNIEYVNHLLLSYKSNPSEWQKYAKFDRYRYTRNLVDAGNGKFNLMVLCWNLGNASPIHDHADSHCFMKMLSGELTEIRYAWPETQSTLGHSITAGNDDEEGEGEKPVELFRSTLKTDGVAYINDNLGLHSVENPSHSSVAVSLHLYCPPFDACATYNSRTGKATKCKVTFWSIDGKKLAQ